MQALVIKLTEEVLTFDLLFMTCPIYFYLCCAVRQLR